MLADELLDRAHLSRGQGERLARLLAAVYGRNRFYTRKYDEAGLVIDRLVFPRDLARLPFTTKAELIADQAAYPPWGTALTCPQEEYTRYCQTSSSTGSPLRWLDTNDSWQWLVDCWMSVFRGAHATAADRAFFPFSFGPFLGFWAGFEAGWQMGLQVVPGGGMSSPQRLAMIDAVSPTIVCCTPTYALHLSDVAAASDRPRRLLDSGVRMVIVAGEPGGSIPATRERIERGWGARVIDHHGLTEVGPVSFECWEAPGYLHLIETAYICEVIHAGTDAPADDGTPGELVITNLGRTGSPVIRYRTGDIVVRDSTPCPCGRTWARLKGGVVSRADDMVNVRGVNVYPSAIEAVVRRHEEIVEFRSTVTRHHALASLVLEVEVADNAVARDAVAATLTAQLREALGLTVPVTVVEAGALPRFEMKARRFIVER
jgi:phenylacetate-CoA ligase